MPCPPPDYLGRKRLKHSQFTIQTPRETLAAGVSLNSLTLSHSTLAVQEAIKAELQSLKTQLAEKDNQLEEDRRSRMELQQEVSEKTEQLEKDRKRLAELRQELEELQRVERGSRNRAYSFPNLDVKPMEDQVILRLHFALHAQSVSRHHHLWASCTRVLWLETLRSTRMMRTQSYRRVSFSASFKPGVVSSSLMYILHQGVLSGDIKVPSDENPELWKGLVFFFF